VSGGGDRDTDVVRAGKHRSSVTLEDGRAPWPESTVRFCSAAALRYDRRSLSGTYRRMARDSARRSTAPRLREVYRCGSPLNLTDHLAPSRLWLNPHGYWRIQLLRNFGARRSRTPNYSTPALRSVALRVSTVIESMRPRLRFPVFPIRCCCSMAGRR
jgi:hypothetical protein